MFFVSFFSFPCISSFHSVMPVSFQTKRSTLSTVTAAVDLGLSEWNDGRLCTAEKLHHRLHLTLPPCLAVELKRRDDKRKSQSEAQEKSDHSPDETALNILETIFDEESILPEEEIAGENLKSPLPSPEKPVKKSRSALRVNFGANDDAYGAGLGD